MSTHLADIAVLQIGAKKAGGTPSLRGYAVKVTPRKPDRPGAMRKLEPAEVERLLNELRTELRKSKFYAEAPAAIRGGKSGQALSVISDPQAIALDRVKHGCDWLSGEEVGRRSSSSASNLYAKASRWLKERKVFAIELDGGKKFPAYAFEPSGAPVPALREVLQVLDGMSPFAIAAWFESTSSTLGGKRPRELLALDSKAVLDAARALRDGPGHG